MTYPIILSCESGENSCSIWFCCNPNLIRLRIATSDDVIYLYWWLYKVYIGFKLNRSVADLAGIQTCSSTMRDFYPSLTHRTADLVIHMGDTKYFEHENFTKRKGMLQFASYLNRETRNKSWYYRKLCLSKHLSVKIYS